MGVIGDMCEFGWGDGCMGDRFVGEATDREERLRERAVEGLSVSFIVFCVFIVGWDGCW